eukprot:4874407-Prymnesium_polylepis.3
MKLPNFLCAGGGVARGEACMCVYAAVLVAGSKHYRLCGVPHGARGGAVRSGRLWRVAGTTLQQARGSTHPHLLAPAMSRTYVIRAVHLSDSCGLRVRFAGRHVERSKKPSPPSNRHFPESLLSSTHKHTREVARRAGSHTRSDPQCRAKTRWGQRDAHPTD